MPNRVKNMSIAINRSSIYEDNIDLIDSREIVKTYFDLVFFKKP